MFNQKIMKTYAQLLLVGMLLFSLTFVTACEKEEDPEPEPTLTETERLLTTKKWSYDKAIDYGAFDMATDSILANQDTSETTRPNRHMEFNLDGDAFFKDTAADTTTVEYLYTLNEAQTEMRLWEPLSVQFPAFYSDRDYVILQLDENTLILKGDSKRQSAELGFSSYRLTQLELSAF